MSTTDNPYELRQERLIEIIEHLPKGKYCLEIGYCWEMKSDVPGTRFYYGVNGGAIAIYDAPPSHEQSPPQEVKTACGCRGGDTCWCFD